MQQSKRERTALIMCYCVMLSASASFMTPYGYTTNLLIYGPGGYTVRDYCFTISVTQFVVRHPRAILYFGLTTVQRLCSHRNAHADCSLDTLGCHFGTVLISLVFELDHHVSGSNCCCCITNDELCQCSEENMFQNALPAAQSKPRVPRLKTCNKSRQSLAN